MTTAPSKRLQFIDFARGVVMILMAWDHASTFWNPLHQGGEGLQGFRPRFANTGQFLLRFVTHYAAPTFIFLAGVSLALSTVKRAERGQSQITVSLHLILRGVILLAIETLLISPAFDLPRWYFGVIACIGVCLILFSTFRFLPWWMILSASLMVLLFAPFLSLEAIPSGTGHPVGHYLHVIIADPRFDLIPYVGLYPVIPWIGVMGCGWAFGTYLGRQERDAERLRDRFVYAGVALLVLWYLIRLFNGYGNLLPRIGTSTVGWLMVSKYPPSLAFLTWTLAGTAFFMAVGMIIEEHGWLHRPLISGTLLFGRVPLFFYILHLWLYRLLEKGFSSLIGEGTAQAIIIWLIRLILLWVACLYYDRLKRRYPRSVLQYV